MNEAELIDFADKAVRTVLGRHRCWTEEDWDDARQEAVIGILDAMRRGLDDSETWYRGYLFNAARNQIYEWMRMWLRHPRGGTLIEYLEYAQIDNDPRQVDIELDKLAIMLQFQNLQNVDRAIRYIELRMAGFSTAGIAMELGITGRNVYAIRELLMPRLHRILRGEDPPDRGALISAAKRRKRATA